MEPYPFPLSTESPAFLTTEHSYCGGGAQRKKLQSSKGSSTQGDSTMVRTAPPREAPHRPSLSLLAGDSDHIPILGLQLAQSPPVLSTPCSWTLSMTPTLWVTGISNGSRVLKMSDNQLQLLANTVLI